LCLVSGIDQTPRGLIVNAIRHLAFLAEAICEDLDLDQRIRQRGVIFDKAKVTRAKTIGIFCASAKIASLANPALLACNFLVSLF